VYGEWSFQWRKEKFSIAVRSLAVKTPPVQLSSG